jgi:AraC-like DNA-binding protein
MARLKDSTKVTPAARALRKVIAENLLALIEREYPLDRYPRRKQRLRWEDVGGDVGCSASSVQRAIDPEEGMTVYTLAQFASAFHVSPSDLLKRNFFRSEPMVRQEATNQVETEGLQRARDRRRSQRPS